VFAIGQRSRAPLQVRRRRQWHVHEIDILAVDELGITTQRHRDGMLEGESPRALQVAGCDGDHFGAEQIVGRSHDAARGDPCRAQDSDAYHGASLA
jgi:hypothetical protein